MTHRYYPRDMQTAPTVEIIDTVCPCCKGTNVLAIGVDEFNPDYAVYVCYECEVEFKIYEPIPY